MTFYRILLLLFAAIIIGCEAPQNISATTNEKPEIVGNEPLSLKNGIASGTGRMEFQRPLSGYSSAEHFIIAGQFLADTSELEIHNHFTGFNYLDGVQLLIIRQENQLEFKISTPGYITQNFGNIENILDTNGHFRLRIEIHHFYSTGLRILIWNDRVINSGNINSSLDLVLENNALLDTSEAKMTFRSFGEGIKWGLRIQNVNINLITRESAYVPSP